MVSRTAAKTQHPKTNFPLNEDPSLLQISRCNTGWQSLELRNQHNGTTPASFPTSVNRVVTPCHIISSEASLQHSHSLQHFSLAPWFQWSSFATSFPIHGTSESSLTPLFPFHSKFHKLPADLLLLLLQYSLPCINSCNHLRGRFTGTGMGGPSGNMESDHFCLSHTPVLITERTSSELEPRSEGRNQARTSSLSRASGTVGFPLRELVPMNLSFPDHLSRLKIPHLWEMHPGALDISD